MTVHYPNGKKYTHSAVTAKPKHQTTTVFGNRGKTFEDELNETNDFYLANRIAVIHKKPVPIQVVKVDYPSRSSAVIKEAYYRTPSTTDYNGVWKGKYIDFEAKETKHTTSFPLKNIHEHQIVHMQQVIEQQGISFLIVRFSSLDRYFLLSFETLNVLWRNMHEGGRKSIPLSTFEEKGIEIMPKAFPRIDYLHALNQLL